MLQSIKEKLFKQPKRIKLIIGPSSSGKSCYINRFYKKSLPVLLGSDLVNHTLPDADVIVHYNSFRPYDNSAENLNTQFCDDPTLEYILKSDRKIEATILVASKSNLIKRASLREHIEPDLRSNNAAYPAETILCLLNNN